MPADTTLAASPYLEALKNRVLVFDGAMGTSIQRYELTAAEWADSSRTLRFTRPA